MILKGFVYYGRKCQANYESDDLSAVGFHFLNQYYFTNNLLQFLS